MEMSSLSLDSAQFLVPGLIGMMVYHWILQKPFTKPTWETGFIAVMAEISRRLAHLALPDGWEAFEQSYVLGVACALTAIGGLSFGAIALYLDGRRRARRSANNPTSSTSLHWSQIFRGERKHVLLNLKDGRRVLGWPEGWPSNSKEGHFFLIGPVFLTDSVSNAALDSIAVMIPVGDVDWIQFLEENHARKMKNESRCLSLAPEQLT